jgi:hypothetical protein
VVLRDLDEKKQFRVLFENLTLVSCEPIDGVDDIANAQNQIRAQMSIGYWIDGSFKKPVARK